VSAASPPDPARPAAHPAVPRVLVGVDGSSGSSAALRWALHWAAARGGQVQVVIASATAAAFAWRSSAEFSDLSTLEAVHDEAWVRARTVVDQVRRASPAVDGMAVSVEVATGPPADVLVARSGQVDLLVVGTRGRGAVAEAVLGSVALDCVSRADCPVVVVPDPGTGDDPVSTGQVVVGVDGSARSAAAVARAVEEAGPDGTVTAVRVYGVADLFLDGHRAVTPTRAGRDAAELAALERDLGSLPPGVVVDQGRVRRIAVGGEAGPLLVRQVGEGDLLVVASRGHGELRGLVLGSVALYCVRHAPCPVLVVRPEAAPVTSADPWPTAAAATTGPRR
ncbi:Universal stress protein A, partial [Klenkia terrae]|jgi:nucleotide-binding universal stress UspA family protein